MHYLYFLGKGCFLGKGVLVCPVCKYPARKFCSSGLPPCMLILVSMQISIQAVGFNFGIDSCPGIAFMSYMTCINVSSSQSKTFMKAFALLPERKFDISCRSVQEVGIIQGVLACVTVWITHTQRERGQLRRLWANFGSCCSELGSTSF